MPYKTILTYLPDKKTADRLLNAAMSVARENDAHLVGLHVIPRVPVMYSVAAAEIPQAIVQQQEELLQAEANELREHFEETCRKGGVKAEWRCNRIEHADMASEISSQALCADLIVTAQNEEGVIGLVDDLPSRIVTEAGRPVLIIPRTGNYPQIGKNVVIAWNGSKEATRASLDALPFLKSADGVKVLAIDPKCREGYDNIALGGEMALCLARHDVKTKTAVTASGPISVGDAILNRLADENYDLLVMGCYGHSRLRETLFGGVTRDLLEHMTAPVLMSH